MNPYFVLDVPPDADDACIRRAYLEAIKLSPPDLEPKRFQALSSAYEQIKDERSRHRHSLFNQTPPGESPLDVLVRFAQFRREHAPLPAKAMKEFLRSCTNP